MAALMAPGAGVCAGAGPISRSVRVDFLRQSVASLRVKKWEAYMSIKGFQMSRKLIGLIGAVALMFFGAAGPALAGQPSCKTNGPVVTTSPSPSSYSYVQTDSGSKSGSFTVSPPTGTSPANCSPAVGFGNTEDTTVGVTISVNGVTDCSGNDITDGTLTGIENAFSFDPASFNLDLPPSNQVVDFTFTNSSSIPVGTYCVDIHIAPDTGTGVGSADTTFTLTVSEPVAVDTLPPDVTINSPADNSSFSLNSTLNFDCSATDPYEDGAGTGVQSMTGTITACLGAFSQDLSLTNDPPLPVDAGTTTDATATETLGNVGSFTVTCTATDGASHTGQDQKSFTVGVGTITALPPISVVGKLFKSGSTVPIKWQITDANGNFLPPFGSISIVVTKPDSSTYTAVAGSGDANIRWELDADGNATQYITNFSDTSDLGSYTVNVYVNDVCGTSTKQGSFSFTTSTKGK
jgi:hypothetical protein